MDAIFRVDGNRVVTSPDAAALGSRHAARLRAGVAGGVGGRSDSDAGADADRARHHRPDAPGAGGAADARDRSAARGPQDPAVRRPAARRRRRRGRRHRAQDQDARRWRCRRRSRSCRSNCPDRINRASSRRISPRALSSRACRCAPRGAGSACPVPARSGTAPTGRWSRARRCRRRCAPWSRRIFATAPRAVLDFRAMDLYQCRPHRQLCAPAGRRVDIARCGNPGSAPMAPASPMARLADTRGYFGRAVQSLRDREAIRSHCVAGTFSG